MVARGNMVYVHSGVHLVSKRPLFNRKVGATFRTQVTYITILLMVKDTSCEIQELMCSSENCVVVCPTGNGKIANHIAS